MFMNAFQRVDGLVHLFLRLCWSLVEVRLNFTHERANGPCKKNIANERPCGLLKTGSYKLEIISNSCESLGSWTHEVLSLLGVINRFCRICFGNCKRYISQEWKSRRISYQTVLLELKRANFPTTLAFSIFSNTLIYVTCIFAWLLREVKPQLINFRDKGFSWKTNLVHFVRLSLFSSLNVLIPQN